MPVLEDLFITACVFRSQDYDAIGRAKEKDLDKSNSNSRGIALLE